MCQGLCYRGFGSTGTLHCCIHQARHLQPRPRDSPLRGQGIYSGSSRGSFLLRSLPLSLTSLPSEMSSEPVDPSTLGLDDNLNKITKPLWSEAFCCEGVSDGLNSPGSTPFLAVWTSPLRGRCAVAQLLWYGSPRIGDLSAASLVP